MSDILSPETKQSWARLQLGWKRARNYCHSRLLLFSSFATALIEAPSKYLQLLSTLTPPPLTLFSCPLEDFSFWHQELTESARAHQLCNLGHTKSLTDPSSLPPVVLFTPAFSQTTAIQLSQKIT